MSLYINTLLHHLAERHSRTCGLSGEDLLEQLWHCYLEDATIEPAEIRAAFREVDSILEQLAFRDADRIFDLTCQLCCLYQRSAFLDGMTLGLQLSAAV